MNVFISFAKEDKNAVSRLEEIVRHGGRRSWQFVYDLHGGRDWRTEIQYKIDRCEVFLFVMTDNSLQSEWCLKELQHAALTQKPIVTVALKSDIDIPYPLCTIQYVLFDETPESGATLTRALQDPRPISREMIPPHWERLGGGPMGIPTSQSQIPIPRIRRELTDMEKEDFLYESIKRIRDYFGRGLTAFENSDPRIKTRIRDESNTAFKCQIYLDGNIKKSCRVWISSQIGMNGIAYSEAHGHMASYAMNSYNELAQVEELDGNPALEFTLGMVMFTQPDDCKICTVEQACERLWKYFVKDFNDESTYW